MLGIGEDYEHFDQDIIMYINSVFSVLTQLGIGPSEGFLILDKSATWAEYLEDNKQIEMVRSYMYLKVRLLFDPPTSTGVMDSFNNMIKEYEWRLNIAVDPKETEG